MFADEQAPVAPTPPDDSGWVVRTGLTLREAEELLDCLEAAGVSQREALVTPDGVVVRWRP